MTDFSAGVKKVLGATSVIVGTVIGAGYISGREIAEFFLTGDLAVSALCSFLLVLPALYFLLTNKLFEKGALKNVSEIFIFAGNLVMLGGMLSAADEVFSSLFSFFFKDTAHIDFNACFLRFNGKKRHKRNRKSKQRSRAVYADNYYCFNDF